MTDQVEDFKEYISETQKMRAYRGKIEPHSPLAASAAAPKPVAPAPKPAPPPEKKAAPKPAPPPEKKPAPPPLVQIPNPLIDEMPATSGALTNLIAVGAIVLLALAAVGLVIALVMK